MEEVDCPYCSTIHTFDTADIRDEGHIEDVICETCEKEYEVYLSISWNYYAEEKEQ